MCLCCIKDFFQPEMKRNDIHKMTAWSVPLQWIGLPEANLLDNTFIYARSETSVRPSVSHIMSAQYLDSQGTW